MLFTDVIKKAHDKKVGLWVTEIGAGSDSGGKLAEQGQEGSGQAAHRRVQVLHRSMRNKFNVQAVDWFSWQDSQTRSASWCPSSGLLTLTGGAKPSLKAFVKLTGGSTG